MTVEDHSFRTWQAVGDLVHHVALLLAAHLGAVAVASGLSIGATGAAFGRLRDDGFRFGAETEALRQGLEALAISRAEGFELAVVVLLADGVQARAAGLSEVWREAAVRWRDWPDTLRAAVANGIRQGVELAVIVAEPPSDAECLTRGAEAIAGPLLRVVRAMRPDELLSVAEADDGQNVERHLATLQEDIRQRDGIFLTGESWFPKEVVELTAGIVGAAGFEGCTAILLLNALKSGDGSGQFDVPWASLAAAYEGLRPSARDPILAAIRYFYETDREFLAVSNGNFQAGPVIPVVDAVL